MFRVRLLAFSEHLLHPFRVTGGYPFYFFSLVRMLRSPINATFPIGSWVSLIIDWIMMIIIFRNTVFMIAGVSQLLAKNLINLEKLHSCLNETIRYYHPTSDSSDEQFFIVKGLSNSN